MDCLYRCVCGLDVHKDSVAACVTWRDEKDRVRREVQPFGTTTREIERLRAWLSERGVSHVAMESTGVYWVPIYNLLEDHFELLLVNAQAVKRMPGRKTDVSDAEWLASLQLHGLLAASFVPPRAQRELRDLTRLRSQLVGQQAEAANRVQKVLEQANCKLGSVASDVRGVSGRAILAAMVAGETDPVVLAELAQGRLREKLADLREALLARVNDHHRFLLGLHLAQIDNLQEQIDQLSARIEAIFAPFRATWAVLLDIPGVGQRTVENILAEIGWDLSRFPTAAHLASWAKVCPGTNESAGKRRGSSAGHGDRWLRTALVQAAWAASHTKNSYFAAYYRRLAQRRGKKRALLALAHALLVTIYHLLTDGAAYHDLGPEWVDRRAGDQRAKYYLAQLRKLGYDVALPAPEQAA